MSTPPPAESWPSAPDLPVAVIGAGTMGLGIAQVAAQAGHPVILVDSQVGAPEKAVSRISAALDRLVDKGRTERADADSTLSRLTTHTTADMATTLEQYDVVKSAIQQAFMDAGATLSHHHGVGVDHAPWLEQDLSEGGVDLMVGLLKSADPKRNLNPGTIIPPHREW